MYGGFTSGSFVHVVRPERKVAAGQTETLAHFQYSGDAIIFAEQKAVRDRQDGILCGYYVVEELCSERLTYFFMKEAA